MESTTVNVTIPYDSTADIIPIGDTHLGGLGCNVTKIKETIDYVKEHPTAQVILMGDMVDAINRSDPRFEASLLEPGVDPDDLIRHQCDRVIELFEPIKDQIIGMVIGNHEDKLKKFYHFDPTRYMCDGLGIRNLGYSGFILLKIDVMNSNKSKVFRIYYHHGFGGGRTRAGKLTKLYKMYAEYAADIYILGHFHSKIWDKHPYVHISNSGKVTNRLKVGMVVPSFLETYVMGKSTYAEKKGYNAVANKEFMRVIIKPDWYLNNRYDELFITDYND